MKMITLQFIMLMVVCAAVISAQEKTITIWPHGVPNSIKVEGYNIEKGEDGWTWMRKISNPVLDYYPAPAGKANGTAIVICPGGGYWGLAYKHEGSDVAEWFNTLGITAFVLKSRLPDDEIMKDKTIGPLQDAQEAMRIVRRHAKEWNIDPDKIGVLGFSAGGHLASTVSTHYNDKVYDVKDNVSARPDFSILIYPVITMDASFTHMGSRENLLGKDPSPELVKKYSNELQVDDNTPPAFLVHSADDDAVPVLNSIKYLLALKDHHVKCELHIYESGGHGYGMGRSNDTESSWPEACEKWLKARGLL